MTLKGRTLNKFSRVYADGYDLSGYARSIGPLSCTFQEGNDDPLNAAVIGTWLGQATISPGTINSMFDNTSDSGIHAVMKTPAKRAVMVPIGIQAIPAEGDPVFCGQFQQSDYITDPAATPSALTIKFAANSGASASLLYSDPWGILLHANSYTSDLNAANGIDCLAATSNGGFMMYQVFSASGAGHTADIIVEDAAVLAGPYATLVNTTVVDVGTAPIAGIVPLATTAAVRQFVRWQVAWGTATNVTFALAFVRGKPR
jgi:hypothetical protein